MNKFILTLMVGASVLSIDAYAVKKTGTNGANDDDGYNATRVVNRTSGTEAEGAATAAYLDKNQVVELSWQPVVNPVLLGDGTMEQLEALHQIHSKNKMGPCTELLNAEHFAEYVVPALLSIDANQIEARVNAFLETAFPSKSVSRTSPQPARTPNFHKIFGQVTDSEFRAPLIAAYFRAPEEEVSDRLTSLLSLSVDKEGYATIVTQLLGQTPNVIDAVLEKPVIFFNNGRWKILHIFLRSPSLNSLLSRTTTAKTTSATDAQRARRKQGSFRMSYPGSFHGWTPDPEDDTPTAVTTTTATGKASPCFTNSFDSLRMQAPDPDDSALASSTTSASEGEGENEEHSFIESFQNLSAHWDQQCAQGFTSPRMPTSVSDALRRGADTDGEDDGDHKSVTSSVAAAANDSSGIASGHDEGAGENSFAASLLNLTAESHRRFSGIMARMGQPLATSTPPPYDPCACTSADLRADADADADDSSEGESGDGTPVQQGTTTTTTTTTIEAENASSTATTAASGEADVATPLTHELPLDHTHYMRIFGLDSKGSDAAEWARAHYDQEGHAAIAAGSLTPVCFNVDAYISLFADLRDAQLPESFDRRTWAVQHYLQGGRREIENGARHPDVAAFNHITYLTFYKDLEAATASLSPAAKKVWAIHHYLEYGYNEIMSGARPDDFRS